MGRPRNADGERTRQAILDAALDLFAARGYFGTSLRDIATAVSIRESALYNYFESKERLFEALILVDHESKDDLLSTLGEDPITDVRVTLTRLCSFVLEKFSRPSQRQLFRIFMSDGLRLAKEGHIKLFDRLGSGHNRVHELMRQLIRAGGLRPAEPQFLAMAFMGPLVLWRQLHAVGLDLPATSNLQAFARHHVDQFLRGAAVRPSRPSPRPHSKRTANRTARKRPLLHSASARTVNTTRPDR